MKKLLSIVLTIAMLVSMLSVPMAVGAQSYPTIDLNSGFAADSSFALASCTETAVYGIAGKDSSDESVMMKETSNAWTSWYQYNHGEELYFENGEPMEGYLVVELNFMAPDSAYLKEFIFGISGNQQRMTVDPTSKIQIGKWNHMRMVYWADETNCDFVDYSNDIPNTAAKLGSTILYLNGAKLGQKDLTCTATTYSDPISKLLLEVYSGDKTAQHATYYDDIKIYKSAEDPGAPSNAAIAATSEYTISGTSITLASGAALTPAEIAAANSGYTITAFEDASLSTQLASGANLALENVVVAKSPDGVYTYYAVADASTTILYSEKDGSFAETVKVAQTAATGVAGKAIEDESALFATGSNYDGNIMINRTYTKSKKYLVIEANINPVDGEYDTTGVSVHTTSHAGVSGGVGADKFTFGQWNKYLMYVDFTGSSPKAYTYVNGKLVIDGYSTNSKLLATNATLRICFNGLTETIEDVKYVRPFSVYVDDMKWYETDNLPDGASQTALPAPASSTYYSVADGKVKALPTTTIANIKAANTANTVRVFTDSTMTAYAEDTATVQSGMVVAVENGYKAVATYPVTVSYGETEIYLATGDADAAFPTVNNATSETVTTGYGGKDGSVLKITQTGADTWFGTTWGKTTAGTDSAGTGATWDKYDYVGYLVAEFSIFNVDCGTIGIVTDGSQPVTGGFATAIPKNQWSRVKVVIDETGGTNDGKAIVYIDGVAKTNWTAHMLGTIHSNKAPRNAIRFQIKGGETPSYVDDIRIYEIPALRAEETIAFTAPGTSAAAATEFGIVEGTTVTVGDVKNANPDIAVKVFNSKTDYTEITDTTAALSAGNVIYVNKQSQSAIDAGINYKDLFRIMTVVETPATKDVITAPAGGTRYTLSDVADGVYGNTSSTIKMATDTNTSDSNWYFGHSYKGVSAGMNYLVFETDFAPTSDIQYMFVGANQHGPLSASVNVGTELTANQWHKVVMVYDVANDHSDMYVNGKLVSENFSGVYNTKLEANNGTIELRVIVQCKMGSVSYFDNYKFYESVVYPTIADPATLAAGYNAAVGGFVDNTSMVASVKNGTDADIAVSGSEVSVLDSNYNAVTDVIENGDIIFVKKSGNFAYYNVNELANNDIVILGDTYDANTGVMTPGSITAYGVTADGGVVVVAQFDEEGNMIKAKSSAAADANGIVTVAFDADDIDDTVVKAFLLENFDTIKPLCENKDIAHTRSYNLLMLGNSFSMDVTCYMEEIAAAADKKFNIAVLNKGGSAVAYHYTNREMPLESSDIYFWLNDKGQGYSNLKTVLENYDWDYVVIQNWGGNTAFYENTDSNYAANWAVITDLAKYIHEKEPGAELMLHETWSFEAGYNTWADVATRDAAGANIRAVYDRCAADIKAELGLDYDVRKISSLDAFEAARAYENADGVQIFETTYYKDGHLFSGYENRATVSVGDGTQLLSPEDAAAGKTSLHRDGFHASAAARYLIALNAVQFLTDKSVYGNTYRPGEIALDSSAYYGGNEVTDLDNASSGVIYQKYDALSEDIVSALQTVVEGMR